MRAKIAKFLRMTKKRRVMYPFVLGGVTVYILLFTLHVGSDVNYYRRIAQDLNPLSAHSDREQSPQHHKFHESLPVRDRKVSQRHDEQIENVQTIGENEEIDIQPEVHTATKKSKEIGVGDAKIASDIMVSADELYRSLVHEKDGWPIPTAKNIDNNLDEKKSPNIAVNKTSHESVNIPKDSNLAVSTPLIDSIGSAKTVENFQGDTSKSDNIHKLPDKPWRDDVFEKLTGLDLYVRNAFYDKRNDNGKKVIKLWTINPLKMPNDVYCHVMWIKKHDKVEMKVIKGFLRIQESTVRPFCKYFTGVLECSWNETYVPKYVSISPTTNTTPNQWHNIRHINLPEKPPKKIGICLKTLFDHGDDSIGPLMEWFELNKLLGVDKVIMYGYDNVTAKIKKLINHYQDTGFVNMKSWKLPMKTYTKNIYKMKFTDPKMRELVRKTTTNQSDIPCIRYHAQHLTYMDCIYDNMHKYNYLVFIDVDEYIIPEANRTLKDLLGHLDTLNEYAKTASFVFEEACFTYLPKTVLQNNTKMTLLTQNYTRGPITSDHKAMKSVLRPRYVKNMHIHRVAGKLPSIWGYKGFDYINRNLGKLHHYKNSGRCTPYNFTDEATSQFQTKLVAAMGVVWSKLYGAGK